MGHIPNKMNHDLEISETIFERKDFKAYAKLIETIIKRSKPSMTIGDIHRALGKKTRIEWTYTALRWLSDRIIPELKIPERYFYREPAPRIVPNRAKTHDETTSAIFYKEPTKAILPTAALMGELRN